MRLVRNTRNVLRKNSGPQAWLIKNRFAISAALLFLVILIIWPDGEEDADVESPAIEEAQKTEENAAVPDKNSPAAKDSEKSEEPEKDDEVEVARDGENDSGCAKDSDANEQARDKSKNSQDNKEVIKLGLEGDEDYYGPELPGAPLGDSKEDQEAPKPLERDVKGEIMPGESLSGALGRFDISVQMAIDIGNALKDIFDIRHMKPGNQFEVKFDKLGQMTSFTLNYSLLTSYYVRREGEELRGYQVEGETNMYVEQIAGIIESNLSESLWKLGESDQLTSKISEVFAWDIDFYSDCRKGDQWRVMIEKHYFKGRFLRYGSILAAHYHGEVAGDRYVYFFESGDDKVSDYFDEDGNSIRRSFMRAPLDTTRVTSKFGFRMHPTLHKRKKHNGIDYGAARGTPVWAVADGKVTGAGWMGACGKGVKLRHSGGYETIYCHLSRFYVASGQKVKQKRMIGRVGNTGRSTGPHLHFGVKYKGQWINPLKIKYTPGKPLAKQYRDRYKEARQLLTGKLKDIPLPLFHGPEVADNWVDPTCNERNTKTVKNKKKSNGKTKKNKKKNRWKKNPPKGYQPRPPGIKRVSE